jgi:ribosomal-protein-alanine N-acetyltransferase
MLEVQLTPFPVLQTPRLVLRQIEVQDAHEIFMLRSDDRVLHYINREKMASVAEATDWINKFNEALAKNESINWGICLKNDQKLIGSIAFWRMVKEHHRAEIGYTLHPDHWNKGLVNEALTAVLDCGFRHLNLHTVEGNVNPENKASIRLLQKQGFGQEGYLKENYFFGGEFYDTAVFSLINPHH